MTAYLQPGDRIHIAFSIGTLEYVSTLTSDEVKERVKEFSDELTRMYRLMGVHVVGTTSSTAVDHPVVVSVVRESRVPSVPRPVMHQPERTEKLRAHWGDPDWREDHLD